MSLSLQVRKAIRDSEPALKANLEKIKQATGKDFELEVDWAYVSPLLLSFPLHSFSIAHPFAIAL